MYKKYVKRFLDITLSGLGLVVLAIPMLVITLFIRCTDHGPAIFKQRRIGKDKEYFMLHKFRSMSLDTPDIPTHLMENPEHYLIRHGVFLRKYCIDELPQLYDIFIGKMSIVGPRPALWNQDDLVAERDKCGANSVRPGLTGWAQINGRDELEIAEKARLDGEYVKNISFSMDFKCFMGTIKSVIKHEGYIEGKSAEYEKGK